MAAIERGDMPTTGVGLPAPPGAAFFEELAGGGGGRRGHTAPAMEEVVAHLPRILVRYLLQSIASFLPIIKELFILVQDAFLYCVRL